MSKIWAVVTCKDDAPVRWFPDRQQRRLDTMRLGMAFRSKTSASRTIGTVMLSMNMPDGQPKRWTRARHIQASRSRAADKSP